MRNRILIKNHLQEIRFITQRVIAAFIMMCILAFLLIIRLGYLQFSQHQLYTTLSQKNRLDLVPAEPTRGLIYDRHGILLAENIPVFSLDVIPDKVANMPQTLAAITNIIPLTDTEIAQFQKQLKQHRRFDEIPLKIRLSEQDVAKFSEIQYRLPGVIIKARLMRHYPFGERFVHVLGYVGRINTQDLANIDTSNYSASNYIGKLGIEKYYENELHGVVGYAEVENDASGEAVRVLDKIKPTPGKNLYLTIDSNLQLAAETALAGLRGAVVAIQPSTGQVLAVVSQPEYDPNLFVTGISTDDFKLLQTAPDRPLYNRALRGLYPIASPIKPFLALQALQIGATDPEFTIFDPGWFQLKNSDHVFYDWQHSGHGTVNLAKAIMTSCDVYFYELGVKMGIQRMDEILTEFGFGQLTGIDIGEELPGLVASPAWKRKTKGTNWYPGDTVNSAIGQGFMQATPLQLATAVATLANRGQRFTPSLLLGEQQPGGPYVQQTNMPLTRISVTDSNYWDLVINAMSNVINSPSGTAYTRYGQHIAYTVAGKTGTAQVYSKKRRADGSAQEDPRNLAEHLRNHSLMVAFAPIENPQIAVAVIVENSGEAVAIARKVIDAYLVHPSTNTGGTNQNAIH